MCTAFEIRVAFILCEPFKLADTTSHSHCMHMRKICLHCSVQYIVFGTMCLQFSFEYLCFSGSLWKTFSTHMATQVWKQWRKPDWTLYAQWTPKGSEALKEGSTFHTGCAPFNRVWEAVSAGNELENFKTIVLRHLIYYAGTNTYYRQKSLTQGDFPSYNILLTWKKDRGLFMWLPVLCLLKYNSWVAGRAICFYIP